MARFKPRTTRKWGHPSVRSAETLRHSDTPPDRATSQGPPAASAQGSSGAPRDPATSRAHAQRNSGVHLDPAASRAQRNSGAPRDPATSRARAHALAVRSLILLWHLIQRCRWRALGWRGKAVAAISGVFAMTVLLPSGIAVAVHGRGVTPVLAWLHTTDAKTPLHVYRMEIGGVVTMPVNDYLVDVLAAEVDPQAPMDALEAAAVAARTYAVRAIVGGQGGQPTYAGSHGADVTDDSQLDLPMLTLADQEAEFKSMQDAYTVRLQQAVQATDGLVLTYNNQPISAFTFRLSPGQTRDAKDVIGQAIPYLKSVECPDDASAAKSAMRRISADELAQRLGLDAKSLTPGQFRIAAMDNLGFVNTITVPGHSWSGNDFARMLQLPSAHFQMQANKSGLTITVEGVGPDVGMSLHEAEAMAAHKKSWQDILGFFYPGTRLVKDESLLQSVGKP